MLYDNINDKYKDYIGKSLFVLSLFLFGLLIFYLIQKPFLDIDEWYTMGILNTSFKNIIHLTAIDVHPPVYYLIARIPIYILNHLNVAYDMIFVMKLASVVPYIILFGIALTKIRKDYGWLAGGLFVFTLISMCDFFKMFSIARMYPWGLLFLVLAFLYAADILKNPSLKNWILVAVFSVLGAYTHYFVAVSAIMLYLVLFIYFMINNKSEIKNFFISVIFGIICYAPWLTVLYKQMTGVNQGYWIESITFNDFLGFFSSVFTFNPELIAIYAFAAVFFVVFIIVLMQFKKSREENFVVLFGFLVFIATVIFGVVISTVFKPIFITRYATPAVGLVWLSLSIFISKFDVKKVVIPVVVVLLLFGAVNLYEQTSDISTYHDSLVKNQEFLKSINNNDSVVIIDGMVKYIHFHDQLNESNVFAGYSIDKKEKARDFSRIFDKKKDKFLMPDDFNKYKNKTIYLAYRSGSDLEIPKYVSKDKVGQIENCKFYKLEYKNQTK